MSQRYEPGVPSLLIWTLGLGLIAADSLSSSYWQGALTALASGKAPSAPPAGTAPFSGLWRYAGMFVLLVLLVLLTEAVPSGGSIAVTFLLAAWVLWLLTHQQTLSTVLGKLQG